MNIFWFRRDLRIEDNKGFFEALNEGAKVLPIFIFDRDILDQLPESDARVTMIHEFLSKINDRFGEMGKSLAVFFGNPNDIFERLLSENKITTVFANHDYEPYARKRDLAVFQILKKHSVAFKTYKDQVIFEKDEVVKSDGSPYVVYTPYSLKWKENFKQITLGSFESESLLKNIVVHSYPFLSLSDIGFKLSEKVAIPYNISQSLIADYEATRNFPALEKTSHIGAYLRFGSVSIRRVMATALAQKNQTFVNELIWREFFMQILWHFPHTVNTSFKPKYDAVKWNNNEDDFQKWCEGNTGYPFVDAGIRELNATGFMHNRVRMITAGFLCKHLLIDWRWGETYFARHLLDYEQASNVGNWQWAAGSGVDAAPYFRIFNPTEQVKKFDKELKYIKKWIPELESGTYPKPIIDHQFARERCLRIYKEAL